MYNNTNISNKDLAAMIDHTLLKQDATYQQIEILCKEAVQYGFASVCVSTSNVRLAAGLLKDSGIIICTVIGFPLGAVTTAAKVFETEEAFENGASEVDMVINIGALKSGDNDRVKNDIQAVVNASNGRGKVKTIIETCLLTDEEKVTCCQIAKAAGAHFVKTSTGFAGGGTNVEDIRLMRKTVGDELGVKASGGIKDYKTAAAMINAGANRIGTSSSGKIINEKLSLF